MSKLLKEANRVINTALSELNKEDFLLRVSTELSLKVYSEEKLYTIENNMRTANISELKNLLQGATFERYRNEAKGTFLFATVIIRARALRALRNIHTN